MRLTRLVLLAGVCFAAAIVAFLAIPGHPLGTFFYNAAPPLFRETIQWEQSVDALDQSNGSLLWSEVQTHIQVSAIAAGIAVAICFPLGVIATRAKIVRVIATNCVQAVRAVPGIAVLFLVYPFLHQGIVPGVLALTLLGSPPIFLNTVAGYASVDRSIVESARGMGMTWRQIFLKIESPLAAPVVIAGLRIAVVEIIASATILAFSANVNTLGTQISYGLDDIKNNFHGNSELAAGIVLVALIALLAELMLSGLQRVIAPAHR